MSIQWEYRIEMVKDGSTNILGFLNSLGKEGWELVSSDHVVGGKSFTFKRRMESAKRWEYLIIGQAELDAKETDIDTVINDFGKEGFRLIPIKIRDDDALAMMEREIPDGSSVPISPPLDVNDQVNPLSDNDKSLIVTQISSGLMHSALPEVIMVDRSDQAYSYENGHCRSCNGSLRIIPRNDPDHRGEKLVECGSCKDTYWLPRETLSKATRFFRGLGPHSLED